MSMRLLLHLLGRFLRDERAAAAEFALVLPAFLLFLLGTIDVGRFIWAVNENAKAVQTGARWAVVTDIIPGGDVGCTTPPAATAGMKCYSYAIHGGIQQGATVPAADFPTTVCSATTGTSLTVSCACTGCPFDTSVDAAGLAAFTALAQRMNLVQPRIAADNVVITYAWSGLGYAGDPNGPDVSPLVTVGLRDMEFRPIFLLGTIGVDLPGGAYSLTMEDGDGNRAYAR